MTLGEWDTLTWQQIGGSWRGHVSPVFAVAVNSTGTLVASASSDNHVRLWRRSDQKTIAMFKHSGPVYCVTFSTDDKYIFSGGYGDKISEWAVPDDPFQDIPEVGCHHSGGVVSHLVQGYFATQVFRRSADIQGKLMLI
jgi:WD40 repeat protein